MNDKFIADLKKKFNPEKILAEEFSLELEIKLPDFSNENVVILFDDFEVSNQKNQKFIIDSIEYISTDIHLKKNDIQEDILNYLTKENQKLKTKKIFARFDVALTTIAFMPNDSLGKCKLFFILFSKRSTV